MNHVYEITNTNSGASLGGYEADDEQGALDALARDAGYEDDAAMCREVPRGKHELTVTLQSVHAGPVDISYEVSASDAPGALPIRLSSPIRCF